MKEKHKRLLISFLVSGLIFAGIMAAVDHGNEKGFQLGKFLFHAFFFGLFMTLVNNYLINREQQNDHSSD